MKKKIQARNLGVIMGVITSSKWKENKEKLEVAAEIIYNFVKPKCWIGSISFSSFSEKNQISIP